MEFKTEYLLPINNYIPIETIKEQIVLGNTFNSDMRHAKGWLRRYNGKYKKTASFTISKNGEIHQHFNPKYYSTILDSEKQNKKSIVILLENEGWLLKDDKKNQFITWLGDIYNLDGVNEKKWRGYEYWTPYTEEQVESIVSLIISLCDDFNIPKLVINHNTKIDNLDDFKGILSKSNLNKNYTDLSPSWDFSVFINKIENIIV
jgi:N-acetyl-anhydromuramyl-L-alanine amidase AmpD